MRRRPEARTLGPSAAPSTDAPDMRAMVQDRYGSTDVLRHAQIARPEATDNEVLVQVHAAGLDRGTWHLMTGKPT